MLKKISEFEIMGSNIPVRLPWRIEAFREYLAYETLQPAAAVLSIYEGENFNLKNPRITEMQELLERRTGKEAWIPKRSGSEDIDWNVEGDVTRNKGRVFTSMLILYPKEWKNGNIALTEFGNALARGMVDKEQFYKFIITRFKYPHPAWKDNWDAWRTANKCLFPFIYILQLLVELFKVSPEEAYVKTEEVADYLHPEPDHTRIKEYARKIIIARGSNTKPITPRSDDIHRKISDILGFLCLTKYCYFKGNAIHFNLIAKHKQENVYFWGARNGQDILKEVHELVTSIKKPVRE